MPGINISRYQHRELSPGAKTTHHDLYIEPFQLLGKLTDFVADHNWFVDTSVEILYEVKQLALAAGYRPAAGYK